MRKPSQGGAIVSLPNATTQTTPVTLIDKNDDDDDDEEDGELSVGDWNWRDDEKFVFINNYHVSNLSKGFPN